ncbi:MAG TPA: hypothetical protein VIT44_00280 [Cyclobacteriaceae bacterium]
MSSEKYLLNKLKKRYLTIRVAETLLLAIGCSVLAFSLTNLISSDYLSWIVAAVAFTGITTYQIISLHLYQFSESRVAVYLNQHYPELEASADLLLNTGTDLTTLQLIQKSQVFNKLQSIESDVKFPHRLLLALIIFVIGIVLWFTVNTYFTGSSSIYTEQTTQSTQSTPVEAQATIIPKLSKLAININPPAYTQVRSTETTNPHLKVIEGSTVNWKFEFSGKPVEPTLVFSGKDSVLLQQKNGSYQLQRTLTEGGFYQLTWKEESGKAYQTDYYPIEIIKDEGPRIEVQNLAQFVELKLTDRLIVDLQANLSDDFGLKDAHIIATVSKGSGESVKFREETLRFFNPQKFSGKSQAATRSIDIVKLGLEPGDELYFYIEAFDNKSPLGNKSRTETFFIALKDTTSYEVTEDEGLGVDLMPEYFRSQRQIIIDSEKILEEQKKNKITKKDFNFKSNELGYDQKVLRLRYGQFMGEEADSGIGNQTVSPSDHEDEKDEDPMKKFGHMHDTENEHHLVAEKKADSHDHAGKEEDKENPMAAFTHNHDDAEEATFLIQSIKTKLRTALTLMWDAELHMRMYDPKTSLPYQYKILKLLKEISNDSRVYVHRSGFDPPPLKEEKRLSGDLSEVKTSFNQRKENKEELYPGIRQALITIESLLLKENPEIDAASQLILQKAGNELAGVAVQQPGAYLKSLSSLRSLIANEVDEKEIKSTLKQVQQSFWKVLPKETISPSAKHANTHSLDAEFLHQLEELKNER